MATMSTTPSGSSPLARGLQPVAPDDGPVLRIIPARAGFTDSPARHGFAKTDHPRSRGVYMITYLNLTPHPRIIPARAGFTTGSSSWASWSPDHPRSRGVYGRVRVTR